MCFLPLKSSHYLSRPVPVPELFDKYPTRPVPKSKTPTRQTLVMGQTWMTEKKEKEEKEKKKEKKFLRTGQPKVVQEVLADLKTGLIDRNN